jgi:hypothetical protein
VSDQIRFVGLAHHDRFFGQSIAKLHYFSEICKMRTLLSTIVCLICLAFQTTVFAQKFRTEAFSDRVKTLRVNVVDRWQSPPIIDLKQEDQVEIKFDVMGISPEVYTYTLTHCNADWTPSQLIRSEFMNGYPIYTVSDYETSFNTTMDYVNYRLTFPNEDLALKISGNYAVQVFPENSDQPVLCACFSVVEAGSDISMQVTSRTDKGVDNSYQQVGFTITCGNEVKMPMQDLKVFVQQNNRTDNEVSMVKPLSIQNRKLIYEHIPALIFEGGNEYRSFEMTTHQHNGLNIESIEFHEPYYHVLLKPDLWRGNRPYFYTEDINGRIFIRTLLGVDFDYEADYYIVHFYLPCEKELTEDVYILSDAFNQILDERSQMEYSAIDKGYVKTVLLKEGYYNYLYVNRKDRNSQASPAIIEGNHYQTENEYRVLVYFRPMGARYDKLIGCQTVQFK